MRAAPVLHAVSGRATRGKVQAIVIGLVALVSTAAVTLALGPRADASAPFERAFAAQHGSEVTTTAKVSPTQLAATTGLAGVTAAAGPFPETTVTATMLMPPPPGQSGAFFPAQQMTVVGRASPGGPVDDLTLHSGHWATQPGQAVLLTDGQAWPVGIGTQITVTSVPGAPRLTVVGTATSITHTATAWVAPAEIAALRAPGVPDLAQMLYRFSSAGTTAQVNADIAALRAALPHGALIGAQSWLTITLPATGAITPWSWWKQAVCDSCILIGLGVLILIVIKDFATLPGTLGSGRSEHAGSTIRPGTWGRYRPEPVTTRACRPPPNSARQPAPSGARGGPRRNGGRPMYGMTPFWRVSSGRRDRPAGRTAGGRWREP